MNEPGKMLVGMWSRLTSEDGLTLTEILVSMMVFLVVSAGVAGTLTAGLQTSVQTRLATMGKEAAQQQIEEMRSRIFYVPFSADPDVGTTADVDLLDRYYPNVETAATFDDSGWEGWYTETGNDAFYTKESPPDEKGIVRVVETRFVDYNGVILTPSDSYDSDIESYDTPPSNLVLVSVTTRWTDMNGASSYELESMISSTGQTVQGGGAGDGEQGCNSTSRNYVESIGGSFAIYGGLVDPYYDIISGTFGEGYASVETGCENQVIGRGTGGTYTIAGITEKGAEATASGPPGDSETDGPLNVGPLATWPSISITSSTAEGDVAAEDMISKIQAQGEARLGGMDVSIYEIEGWPGGTVTGHLRWDFANPIVQVSGPGGDDQFWAELQQEGTYAEGVGKIRLPQINIMPLVAKTADTPSALQGLVFIRNFTADVHSHAGQGSATNSVTYAATIGMFNPSKSASCAGDDCYDIYYSIGPNNPIQTAIDLSADNYRLQNSLFTEFHSFTVDEIADATYESGDGATSVVNIDALLKISANYGEEIKWKIDEPYLNQITLVSQQGYGAFWVGRYNISLNEAS